MAFTITMAFDYLRHLAFLVFWYVSIAPIFLLWNFFGYVFLVIGGVMSMSGRGRALRAKLVVVISHLQKAFDNLYSDIVASFQNRPYGYGCFFLFVLWSFLAAVVFFIPLALLALLARKVRALYSFSMTYLQTKPLQKTANKPFRFLDLPPELRNHVYSYASQDAFNARTSIANSPCKVGNFDFKKHLHGQLMRNLFTVSNRSSSHAIPKNGLALLQTNRQISREATAMFFRNMNIDLEFCFLQSSLRKMSLFVDAFLNKLQFVRSIDIDLRAADLMLFPARSIFNPRIKEVPCPAENEKELLRLRGLLSNLEVMSVRPNAKPDGSLFEDHFDFTMRQAIGFPIMICLAGPRRQANVRRDFPHLRDIRIFNRSGCERYQRLDSDEWVLHYSREPIVPGPLADQDGIRPPPWLIFDMATALTVSTTLDWVYTT